MNTADLTVLYAKDDPTTRFEYINYFKDIFKNVYEAKDTKEAYELYKQHNPDIILTDSNMPNMEALELIEKIRKSDEKVKIIILSAYTDEEKLIRAIPLKLVRYLKKPLKKDELNESLKIATDEIYKEIDKKEEILRLSEDTVWSIEKNALFKNNKKIHLTKNETALMSILSSKTKNRYSVSDLTDAFWHGDENMDMTKDSIRNIIKRIKLKLPPECLENEYGIGYKLCFMK